MASHSPYRLVFRLIPRFTLSALASAAVLFAGIATADYTSFQFTPEKPYYVEDGKVDFGTYNGFRRYHSECHVCHGPAGMGSSYAPALMKSLQDLTYQQFMNVIIKGREGVNNTVMPSFASNMNVLPYLNDIYAYLKARSDGVIGPTRPENFPKTAQNR
jgi:methanol metabolism-related c-type cytochrome